MIRLERREGAVRDDDACLLGECADLFSTQYGTWRSRDAVRVRMSPARLRATCFPDAPGTSVVLAVARDAETGAVVGHAVASRFRSSATGEQATWIAQLVVHEGWRRRGIATRLCRLALLGAEEREAAAVVALIASCNPYAVRALESAAGAARCDAQCELAELERLAADSGVPYVRGRVVLRSPVGTTTIDTSFDVARPEVQSLPLGHEHLALVRAGEKVG